MKKIIFISLGIVILAAFFASANPDGLEKVAQSLGFAGLGIEGHSMISGYSFPFITQSNFSTALAGIAGVFITFGLFWMTAFVLKEKTYK